MFRIFWLIFLGLRLKLPFSLCFVSLDHNINDAETFAELITPKWKDFESMHLNGRKATCLSCFHFHFLIPWLNNYTILYLKRILSSWVQIPNRTCWITFLCQLTVLKYKLVVAGGYWNSISGFFKYIMQKKGIWFAPDCIGNW